MEEKGEIHMFDNMKDFLMWEQASKDTIDFKKIYVDVAGDIVTGVLLSQIIYWNLPSQNGKSKLRVWRENELWLAKGREDWYEECRITAKQFDRASSILVEHGIIEKRTFKFNGDPTVHVRLVFDKFWQRVISFLPKGEEPDGAWLFPKGEEGNSPKGNFDMYSSSISLTENTTEITNKETKTFLPEPSSGQDVLKDLQDPSSSPSRSAPKDCAFTLETEKINDYIKNKLKDDLYTLNNQALEILKESSQAMAQVVGLVDKNKRDSDSLLKIYIGSIKHFKKIPTEKEMSWYNSKKQNGKKEMYSPKQMVTAMQMASLDGVNAMDDNFHTYITSAYNVGYAFVKKQIADNKREQNKKPFIGNNTCDDFSNY